MMMLLVMTWSSLPSGPPRGNKTYQLLTENWYKWLYRFFSWFSIFLMFPTFSFLLTFFIIIFMFFPRFYLFISMPGRGEMTLISAGRVADKQVLHISFPQRSQSISTSCVFPLKTNPPILCLSVLLRPRTACFSLTTTQYSPQADYEPPPSSIIRLCQSLT